MQKELYKGDRYRVSWSIEEEATLKADGWSEDKPEGHAYIPLSAPEASSEPEEVKPRRGRPPLNRDEE